jgi:hypothetical protein
MSKYKSLYDIQRALEKHDELGPHRTVHMCLETLQAIRDIMSRPDEPEPDTRYNGWTNYPTWRVNLELLSDYCDSLESERQTFSSAYDLAQELRRYTEGIISGEEYGRDDEKDPCVRMAVDYALSFVSDVNYDEIAAHYPDLIESDDDDTDEGDAE